MMGRYCGSCCGGGGCFGVVSLTTYMIASKTCGSIVIVHCPIFVMESLGGFLSSSTGRPSLGFFFDGFVQYFSKMPSLSHFLLDRSSDSAKTRLFHRKKSVYPHAKLIGHPQGACLLTSRQWTGIRSTTSHLVVAARQSAAACPGLCSWEVVPSRRRRQEPGWVDAQARGAASMSASCWRPRRATRCGRGACASCSPFCERPRRLQKSEMSVGGELRFGGLDASGQ